MSQLAPSLTSRLSDLVGPTRVIADAASLAACEVDSRGPSAILQPDSAAEIAEILRFASAERLAVIPMGGRTHLGIGMPPRHYGLALDLSRMNKILACEPRQSHSRDRAGRHLRRSRSRTPAKRPILAHRAAIWRSSDSGRNARRGRR